MIGFNQKHSNQHSPGGGGVCLRRLFRLVLCFFVVWAASSCSRQHYRCKADKEAYQLLNSATKEACLDIKDYRLGVDCRSRMFDGADPDCEPMPKDDPLSHRRMHCVDGKCGVGHWNDRCTKCAESPSWRQYLLYDEKGKVVLNRDSVMELALLHSPEYQAAKENLYLSALRVSQERFRFDVQFFGGDSLFYTASGKVRSPSGTFLTNEADIRGEKLFATGGELLVGFANSITWSFAGPDDWSSSSLINFNFVQPLLRGAGRKIVLEDLTQRERDFLAAIRRMAFFQQGFYIRTVAGGSDLAAPTGWDALGVANTAVSANGLLGLIAQEIKIQNQRQIILNLTENVRQMEEFFISNKVGRIQVEQLHQRLLTSQSELVRQKGELQTNTETYLRSIGLPPDLEVKVDDPVTESFELMGSTLLKLREETQKYLLPLRVEETPLPNDLSQQLHDFAKRGEAEIRNIDYDLKMVEKKRSDRMNSFSGLKKWAAEEQRKGELVDPGIYDSALYFARIDKLKNNDYPRETKRLHAAFRLMKLFADNDEQTVRSMIFNDSFDPETKDALRLLELDDQSDVARSEADAGAGLQKSRDDLQTLKEQIKSEFQAELTPKSPIRDQTALRLNLDGDTQSADKEKKQDDASERLAKLLRKADPYRNWLTRVLTAYQNDLMGLAILQTRLRVENLSLTPTDVAPEDALAIASQRRLDWMNQRASLVDHWRKIEIAGDQLRGSLELTVNGELGTIDKRGHLDADNGIIRMGFRWDSPLTRHAEMINYRRSLIDYQRARRNYYTYVDSVSAELRRILRNIEISQIDFEIQRNAILVTTVQVHLAQLELQKPQSRGTKLDTNLARNLDDALQGLLSAQNKFLDVWVVNQNLRMQLDLLMGTMQLDPQGNWIDPGKIGGEITKLQAELGAVLPQFEPPAPTFTPPNGVPEAEPIANPVPERVAPPKPIPQPAIPKFAPQQPKNPETSDVIEPKKIDSAVDQVPEKPVTAPKNVPDEKPAEKQSVPPQSEPSRPEPSLPEPSPLVQPITLNEIDSIPKPTPARAPVQPKTANRQVPSTTASQTAASKPSEERPVGLLRKLSTKNAPAPPKTPE